MVEPSPSEVLRRIARQMRCLVDVLRKRVLDKDEDPDWSEEDMGETEREDRSREFCARLNALVGDFLYRAMQEGAFAGPEYASLRVRFEQMREWHPHHWRDAVSALGTVELLPEVGLDLYKRPVSHEDACAGLADLIDREAKKLKKRPRITKEEANIRAREALKARRRKGERWTVRNLAKAIGCSDGLAAKLPAWLAYAEENGLTGRKAVAPKAVSLTPGILANEGSRHEELERLIAEQNADFEESPLTPGPRKNPRRRRRL